MKALLVLPVLLFTYYLSYGQTQIPYTVIQARFNLIKRIVQPDIIQLPDSVITFPLTGLTNIINIPGNTLSGAYTEIEMWIVDSKGKIIYNNVIATNKNNGCYPLDTEYCRYMKLQSNYMRHQHYISESIVLK
jgi:hypothetical protein